MFKKIKKHWLDLCKGCGHPRVVHQLSSLWCHIITCNCQEFIE